MIKPFAMLSMKNSKIYRTNLARL